MHNRAALACFICFLLASVLPGCRPSYTNENLEKSIIEICKKENNIDVKVKRVGRTVGIYLPINGLFESDTKTKSSGSITVEDVLAGIRFTKDATEKMENVSMALSRVAMSTDAPVDFYVLIAADSKASGLEIVITRYVMDMKRLILNDVSRGDYVQRILMDMDFGPVTAAEETVRELFHDMEQLSIQTIIARYFARTTNVRIESSDFFLNLSQLEYKEIKKFNIIQLQGLQIDKTKVLVRCKVKEVFTPVSGYENFKFSHASGFIDEYIVLLDTGYIPYMIEQVAVVSKGAVYPEKFKKYEGPEVWDKENFYLEDISLKDFLARQLSGRVRDLYQGSPAIRSKFVINLSKGEYITSEKKFKVTFDIENNPKNTKKEAVDFTEIWQIISQVMRRYDFKDYKAVELYNMADGKREVMSKQELLEKFWPKWLLKK